jgi:transcriptional regulator with XRE-family HTH domain
MRRQRLIDARKASGQTQEQIATVLGVDRTTLGKWERGESTPQPNQRSAYAEALGVSLDELSAMLSSLPQRDGEMPDWLSTYLGMEQSANDIRAHEPRAVYGLLQVPRYVEALVSRISITGVSDAYIQRIVDQRLFRQKRIYNGDLTVDIIQPESALHLRVGDAEIMEEQLTTMAQLSKLPNVTIRITTYAAGQYEARRIGDFGIMSHLWGTPRVYIEGYGGGQFITEAEEVGYFMSIFDHARRIALSPSESRRFILRLADEWSKKK